jgi:chemosensory pili system protein ChpA (sensor histidine kinase/response regulator)
MNASLVSSRIDVSALSWCLPEIQSALEKTVQCVRLQVEATRTLQGDPEAVERSHLRSAQSALHQAHGALAVVDIAGLSKITEEAERLLNAVAEGTLELDQALLTAFSSAFAALVEYSENLIDGAAHHPVMLFPYLRDLKALRNAERNHPADLFFPDLSVKPPRMPEPAIALQDGEAKLVRSQFEQGLLRYLRDSTDASARTDMLSAVARIEQAQRDFPGHAFWWVTLAFFDAMQDPAIAADPYSKRLVARLNLQVRKTLEQATAAADQLSVDTLFQIARTRNASPFVAQVIEMYGMQASVPANFEQATFGRQNAKSVAQFKEAHGEAKLAWDRYTRGHPEALDEFVASCHTMQAHAEEFSATGVAHLCEVLSQLTTVSAQGKSLSETLSLEIATSLLFVEEAFAKRSRVDQDYELRAQDMAQRLHQVALGTAPEHMPQWLAELSNAAQERQFARRGKDLGRLLPRH